MTLSLAWGIENSVDISGQSYQLNLEFSRVLRWYEVFQDQNESSHFKVLLTLISLTELSEEELSVLSQEEKEQLFLEILKKIFGETDIVADKKRDLQGNSLEEESLEPETRYYDLIEDSPYIYASFRQDYQINLLEERGKMHWEEFNTLLSGLSEKTKLRKVIDIRMMKIPDKCTEEERQQVLAAKKAVALKTNREATEFEAMDLLERRKWYEKKQQK